MFRIVKDPHLNLWYVHKKFLFWWIKWSISKSNLVSGLENVPKLMDKGSYNFSFGEYGNFYYIMDKYTPEIEYVKDVKEFKNKYAEYLI